MLQQAEAEVKAVGSAAEAMAIIADVTGWRPDVLVSDIEMPGVDGCSLIRRIRALESELDLWLPAVALTAHSRPEDQAAVLAAGFQVHVAKPVEPAVLRSVVASLAKHV
jgi:CheY-like chemotaxis protein